VPLGPAGPRTGKALHQRADRTFQPSQSRPADFTFLHMRGIDARLDRRARVLIRKHDRDRANKRGVFFPLPTRENLRGVMMRGKSAGMRANIPVRWGRRVLWPQSAILFHFHDARSLNLLPLSLLTCSKKDAIVICMAPVRAVGQHMLESMRDTLRVETLEHFGAAGMR
jgi:hypothetical protein